MAKGRESLQEMRYGTVTRNVKSPHASLATRPICFKSHCLIKHNKAHVLRVYMCVCIKLSTNNVYKLVHFEAAVGLFFCLTGVSKNRIRRRKTKIRS